jgi:transposase-like protein
MSRLFTEEQIQAWIREHNFKDGASLERAFAAEVEPVVQAVLEAEMTEALGYSRYDSKNKDGANSRNGHSKKTVRSKYGMIDLDIPRDVQGEFEPTIVKKHERSLSGEVEDAILSLFAKGTSCRDIQSQMQKVYGVNVSAETVSRITDKVLPIAREWQNRPLSRLYPIVYLDGVMFNVRQDGAVVKKTAYVVFALNLEGRKEVLGIWIGEAESSKFWMTILTDLRNRGVEDILIACVDGLNGFQEAINAVFPWTEVQRCVVHQIRNSTKFVGYNELRPFCADMKLIYTAVNEEAGLDALARFEEKWVGKYLYAVKSWKKNWPLLATFFKYPPEIRRLIYTTNPIENFNRQIRKITKTKSSFPTDDSLFKILYLAVMEAQEKWTIAVPKWGVILTQLSVYFRERVEACI